MKRNKNRKKQIYQTAAKLFRKKGYKAATMRDIAEGVGLEVSSIYSHIKSKEELLIDICISCAEMYENGMNQILKTSCPPIEKINTLLDLHINIAFEYPVSVTVFNDEWRHLPDPYMTVFLEKRKEYESNFIDIIKSGVDQNSILDIDPYTTFHLIINSLKWLHYSSAKFTQSDKATKKDQLKKFILKGLTA